MLAQFGLTDLPSSFSQFSSIVLRDFGGQRWIALAQSCCIAIALDLLACLIWIPLSLLTYSVAAFGSLLLLPSFFFEQSEKRGSLLSRASDCGCVVYRH